MKNIGETISALKKLKALKKDPQALKSLGDNIDLRIAELKAEIVNLQELKEELEII